MSQLPHVVWDMGGVMYRYFTEMMVDHGERAGWPLDQIPLGPTGHLPDSDYDRMLSGEIGERGYLPIVVDRLKAHGIEFDPPRDLAKDWTGRRRTWQTVERIHVAVGVKIEN